MPSRLSAFTVPSMLKCAVGLLSNLKISVEHKSNQNVELFFFFSPATYLLHISLSGKSSVQSLCSCLGRCLLSPGFLHLMGTLRSLVGACLASHAASGASIQKWGNQRKRFLSSKWVPTFNILGGIDIGN